MKKTTIIGKKQILSVAMVLALSAAVWLNVKYATNGSDFAGSSSIKDADLGTAKYVANTSTSKIDDDDYFQKSRNDREDNREEEIEIINDTLNSAKSGESEKKQAQDMIKAITDKMELENSIEVLIKAKGFKDAIAVISDDSCSVVVKSDKELETNQTVQILDIVSGNTEINTENIKIVTVK